MPSGQNQCPNVLQVLSPLNPFSSDVKAAETAETTGLSYEAELKKAIQERTQRESLFEGFFGAKQVAPLIFHAPLPTEGGRL